MNPQSKLYLIPTAISPEDRPHDMVTSTLPLIEVFICERIRTTRRWLKSYLPNYDIDKRVFLEFDKHSNSYPWPSIFDYWEKGKICGLTSEAGTPAVADPGFGVVRRAHQYEIPVVSLPGNNSIILALMSSGFNGNKFTYHGYFPIDKGDFNREVKNAIRDSQKGYAQIYIETPYRNVKTFEKILERCPDNFEISISCDLLNSGGVSITKSAGEWKKTNKQFLHKRPAIFILGKSQ